MSTITKFATSATKKIALEPTKAGGGSLSGAVLDAFRAKITQRLPDRDATAQSYDSPGAMINRLRNPIR